MCTAVTSVIVGLREMLFIYSYCMIIFFSGLGRDLDQNISNFLNKSQNRMLMKALNPKQ